MAIPVARQISRSRDILFLLFSKHFSWTNFFGRRLYWYLFSAIFFTSWYNCFEVSERVLGIGDSATLREIDGSRKSSDTSNGTESLYALKRSSLMSLTYFFSSSWSPSSSFSWPSPPCLAAIFCLFFSFLLTGCFSCSARTASAAAVGPSSFYIFSSKFFSAYSAMLVWLYLTVPSSIFFMKSLGANMQLSKWLITADIISSDSHSLMYLLIICFRLLTTTSLSRMFFVWVNV